MNIILSLGFVVFIFAAGAFLIIGLSNDSFIGIFPQFVLDNYSSYVELPLVSAIGIALVGVIYGGIK